MMMRVSKCKAAAIAAVFGLLSSCQTTELVKPRDPVAEATLERLEQQFLAPFERAGQAIAADRLVIRVSPNFADAVTRPAGGKRLPGREADVVRWSTSDVIELKKRPVAASAHGPSAVRRNYLRFRIGETDFLVKDSADVEVLLRNPKPTLTVHATGRVVYSAGRSKDGLSKPETVQELRIQNGNLQVRR